jgi:hypothetical protein
LHERQPNQRYALQTVTGEALPILKVFLPLILGHRLLKIWVFIVTLILRLNILHAYCGSVDLGRQMLCLAEEEVSLCNPGVRALTFQS